jgi:hypothetical protein
MHIISATNDACKSGTCRPDETQLRCVPWPRSAVICTCQAHVHVQMHSCAGASQARVQCLRTDCCAAIHPTCMSRKMRQLGYSATAFNPISAIDWCQTSIHETSLGRSAQTRGCLGIHCPKRTVWSSASINVPRFLPTWPMPWQQQAQQLIQACLSVQTQVRSNHGCILNVIAPFCRFARQHVLVLSIRLYTLSAPW